MFCLQLDKPLLCKQMYEVDGMILDPFLALKGLNSWLNAPSPQKSHICKQLDPDDNAASHHDMHCLAML